MLLTPVRGSVCRSVHRVVRSSVRRPVRSSVRVSVRVSLRVSVRDSVQISTRNSVPTKWLRALEIRSSLMSHETLNFRRLFNQLLHRGSHIEPTAAAVSRSNLHR